MILNIYDFHDIPTHYLIFCTMGQCFRSDVYQYLPQHLYGARMGVKKYWIGLQLSDFVLLVQFTSATNKVCSKYL